MTDLAIYQPQSAVALPDGAGPLDSWIGVADQAVRLANEICNTPFVPDGLRGSAPAVAAAILAGRELGIGPMTALAHIHVIKGKPGLSAALMRALILAQGHEWQDVDITDTRAVVRGRRRGEAEWTEAAFTADQAKRAQINLGGYPQDKLYARATSRLARRKFADVIAGMPYSAEELEDGTPEGAVLAGESYSDPENSSSNGTAKPAQRTARRRQAADKPAARPGPAAVPTSAASPTPATSSGGNDLPPLPGEEQDSPADETDKDTPGSVSKPQLTKLGAIFTSYGFTKDEREQRLTVASQIVGRELESSSDLSLNEARTLIDTLERCENRENLMVLLDTGEAPDE